MEVKNVYILHHEAVNERRERDAVVLPADVDPGSKKCSFEEFLKLIPFEERCVEYSH
ncbi:hypothetical protein KU306_12705 [Haloferax larsenii]|uniref:Uncharacterized protein n=1 Tax=Haloferax larsenii TaxID=302484 RepID=A0ABY5RC71_HALLR|nr:hypothetical protein [Haloferax larsenii]UVE49764.1 hypothetical protein KU306_12705 [Haloferax larsenii]